MCHSSKNKNKKPQKLESLLCSGHGAGSLLKDGVIEGKVSRHPRLHGCFLLLGWLFSVLSHSAAYFPSLPSPVKSLLGSSLAQYLLYPKSVIYPSKSTPAYFPPFSLFLLVGLLSLLIDVHSFLKKVILRFSFSTSKCTHKLIWGYVVLFEECLKLTVIPRKRHFVSIVSGYSGFQIFLKNVLFWDAWVA